MKRIILGLSVLLMLVQNGFALTDEEFDRKIANESDIAKRYLSHCLDISFLRLLTISSNSSLEVTLGLITILGAKPTC